MGKPKTYLENKSSYSEMDCQIWDPGVPVQYTRGTFGLVVILSVMLRPFGVLCSFSSDCYDSFPAISWNSLVEYSMGLCRVNLSWIVGPG